MTITDIVLATCYLALLVPLAVLGLHKAWMILLWSRSRQINPPPAALADDDLPFVTVQLPIYNERYVVEGLIAAVAGLDYPRDRFEIQVLDYSTDRTTTIVADILRGLPDDLQVHHVREFVDAVLDHVIPRRMRIGKRLEDVAVCHGSFL